ncbi:hypothetical protein DAPPUDRAFT_326968 [Daphnia pulex]|uniref:VWFA domain-containing protein n=1 Tax=Daphnia pulex TaxID=6669 RepID=E9H9B0_DAPPU|nr:hypothetical protein DAPPUDRAFT_326968 [Daphnia pulex]|eukprot:EFX71592.1 hypothetical protein DAPPUDRAFT_326968 [Daphnia pulex]
MTNSGYNNLVVAISSETPASQSAIIIDNIKKMISEASPVLYVATENRAYFQSVHILIPAEWEHDEASPSTWETFNTADVIVDTPNAMRKDLPYTQHNGKCGETGQRIYFTPDYVATLSEDKNNIQYGEPGKVFVHEWAHYRYGIFDEYGTAGGKYPLFYRQSGSSLIEPNICANYPTMFSEWDITTNTASCQTDLATNLYDDNCRFQLDRDFLPETSLASYHQIKSVVHFCKDDQAHAHRMDTQNEHNDKCNGESTWTVVMRSPDFADSRKDKNTPLNPLLQTEFRIVKGTVSRFVVVMDVSGSMKEFNRIGKLGESVRAWIKTDFPSGNQLGMVQFSSNAEILSDLRMIADEKSREEMMAKVPKEVFVATCIGCGLQLAMQMLKDGGIIVLVTDGKNSPGYHDISDVKKDIVDAKIRVITIAYGSEADKNVEHLADVTGGKSYFIKDDDSSEALQQAFVGASTYQSTVKNEDLIFKLFEKELTASGDQTDLTDEFDVDETVGRNLKLSVFNLDDEMSVESVELTGPDGDVVNNFVFDTTTATLTVELAKIGQWSLKVSLKSSQSKPVLVTVTTRLRPDVTTPIRTECVIPSGSDIRDANEKKIIIQAKVLKGNHPVTGASVKAYVVKPNGDTAILDLLDNGTDADGTKDDGVYSLYFAYPNQQGRYTVKCQVNSNHKSFENLCFIGSASPQLFDPQIDETIIGKVERIPMADFTRIASAGSFQVEIPVSSDDSYPPAKVTDLSVMVVKDTAANISIALKWTAPGDDLDSGTVSYYQLKYSDVVTDVMNSNFNNESAIRGNRSIITEEDLVAGSLQPSQAGVQQTATFQLTDVQREKPYYLSLRAVDKADKAGQVSNLVVFFIPDKSVLVLTSNAEDDSWGEANPEDDSNSGEAVDHEINIHINSNEPSYRLGSLLIAAISLISIVCLCVALLMVVVRHTQVYRYDGIPA